MVDHRKRFILIVVLLLTAGFVSTSLISFFVSRASLRSRIQATELPLTSDNVFSEIQRDLIRPVVISSLMANDVFLREWILAGEKSPKRITAYLKTIQRRYHTMVSFFVSERTRTYYHHDGILKQVEAAEPRDTWFFRVREMAQDYELNIDPDLGNDDAMTVFVNHRVLDQDGTFLGAVGVGLTIGALTDLVRTYQKHYGSAVHFLDRDGAVLFSSMADSALNRDHLRALVSEHDADTGVSVVHAAQWRRGGQTVYVNSRFIPELDWYLLVEQTEGGAVAGIHDMLIVNLVLCALVILVTAFLVYFAIGAYRKRVEALAREEQHLKDVTESQSREIAARNRELAERNAELEKALAEVRTLSGFLPICSSCKKIRDDKGYWNQIESYIQTHSNAQFSHGLCPGVQRLFPGYSFDNRDKE